jgi:hypothetical protein
MSHGERDLLGFGIVWILIVGILLYAVFSGAKPSAAPAVGP